jgi:hypothetical protein
VRAYGFASAGHSCAEKLVSHVSAVPLRLPGDAPATAIIRTTAPTASDATARLCANMSSVRTSASRIARTSATAIPTASLAANQIRETTAHGLIGRRSMTRFERR